MNTILYTGSFFFLFLFSCTTAKNSSIDQAGNSVSVENGTNVMDESHNNQDKVDFKGKKNKVKIINENSADLSKDSKKVLIVEGDGNDIEIRNTNTVDISENNQDTIIIKADKQKVRINKENVVDYSDNSQDKEEINFIGKDEAYLQQNGRNPGRAAELGEQFYLYSQEGNTSYSRQFTYSDIALAYLFAAAQLGEKGAQYRLGDIFYYGKLGEDINEYLADHWMKKAAAGGHENALAFLRENSISPKESEIETGDKLLALYSLQNPAPSALPVSQQLEIGKFLYHRGLTRCPHLIITFDGSWQHCGVEAMRYLEPAAVKGNPEAQYRMGHIFFAGYFGIKIDNERASEWLNKAAGQGHEDAKELLEYVKAIEQEKEKVKSEAETENLIVIPSED